MRSRFLIAHVGLLAAVFASPLDAPAGDLLRYVEPDDETRTARVVCVDEVPLVHTTQLLPAATATADDLAGQVDSVWRQLVALLDRAGSSPAHLVKLHVYLAAEDDFAAIGSLLAAKIPAGAYPAVATVVTPLSDADAKFGLDAVAVVTAAEAPREVAFYDLPGQTPDRPAAAAVLPAGDALYVSGQAEPGSLAEATRQTLDSLARTLAHSNVGLEQVVALKAFVTPMSEAAVVRREVARFFGERRVPPLVLVEWQSSLPIEIELIAAIPPAGSEERVAGVRFLTPPGMTASPIYSRVAHLGRGQRLYVSDLVADESLEPDAQVRAIFAELERLLSTSGSDLRHLVKATYYVSQADVSAALNTVRPEYYDPDRPPAASKATVQGTGRAGSTIAIDMLAVSVD